MNQTGSLNMDDYIQRFLNGKPFITPKTVAWYSNAFNQYRKVVGDKWPPTEDHLNTFFTEIAAQKLKPATTLLSGN
jgi:hypothetical protein